MSPSLMKKTQKTASSNNFPIGAEKEKVCKREKERGREIASSQLVSQTLLTLLLLLFGHGYQNHKHIDKEVETTFT